MTCWTSSRRPAIDPNLLEDRVIGIRRWFSLKLFGGHLLFLMKCYCLTLSSFESINLLFFRTRKRRKSIVSLFPGSISRPEVRLLLRQENSMSIPQLHVEHWMVVYPTPQPISGEGEEGRFENAVTLWNFHKSHHNQKSSKSDNSLD